MKRAGRRPIVADGGGEAAVPNAEGTTMSGTDTRSAGRELRPERTGTAAPLRPPPVTDTPATVVHGLDSYGCVDWFDYRPPAAERDSKERA